MRSRRTLFVCVSGVAVCLVLLGLLQSPSTDDQLRSFQQLADDDNDGDVGSHREKPFRYESLRYMTTSSARRRTTLVPNGHALVHERHHLEPSPMAFTNELTSKTRSSTSSGGAGGKHRRHKFARKRGEEPPQWPTTLYYDKDSRPEVFDVWNSTSTTLCGATSSSFRSGARSRGSSSRGADTGSKLTAYGNLFAELRDVIVDRNYCRCNLKGGEMIEDVVLQDESAEYYEVERGCFKLACDQTLLTGKRKGHYDFQGTAHLDRWLNNGVEYAHSRYGDEDEQQQPEVADNVAGSKEVVFDGFTVAVVRYEYANLYHTTTDWYNAFLMMQFFGRTPAETNILLIDAHPFGALDAVWTRLFGSVTRLSALGTRTRFRQLVWSIVGYESPMKIYASSPYPPLYVEFRQHVLTSYNIKSTSSINSSSSTSLSSTSPASTRNCSALSVLFIWRRDYLAHPRNPTGRVQRKISNERELLEYVQRRRPGFRVSGVQIDLLDFGDQLRRIVEADIVVGVHGAGLTHAAFMRPDAGLAEICPNDVWSSNGHFEAIAEWRRMKYVRWVNHDFELEDEGVGSLRVPPYVANALVGKLAKQLCSGTGSHQTDVEDTALSGQQHYHFKRDKSSPFPSLSRKSRDGRRNADKTIEDLRRRSAVTPILTNHIPRYRNSSSTGVHRRRPAAINRTSSSVPDRHRSQRVVDDAHV